MTLVILAAGMGSRYGGMKQVDPVGPNKEFIIDYSCHDAVAAGYDKIVFIIKKEHEGIFRETIGARASRFVKVEYAYQDVRNLPVGFSVPDERTKPWGTAHALLCAEHLLDGPFATVNADDFYGRESFALVADHMKRAAAKGDDSECCMAAYRLDRTLTDNGSVSRGVCEIDPEGRLVTITERTAIYRTAEGGEFESEGRRVFLPGDTPVSMNFFGISPSVFGFAREKFKEFLACMKNPLKDEYYLPVMLSDAMNAGIAKISVLRTPETWFGVTYSADREPVKEGIREKIRAGVYKEDLWSDLK